MCSILNGVWKDERDPHLAWGQDLSLAEGDSARRLHFKAQFPPLRNWEVGSQRCCTPIIPRRQRQGDHCQFRAQSEMLASRGYKVILDLRRKTKASRAWSMMVLKHPGGGGRGIAVSSGPSLVYLSVRSFGGTQSQKKKK